MDVYKHYIFECYRHSEAEVARNIYNELTSRIGGESVWFSQSNGAGNYYLDIPTLLSNVKYVILFISKYFTCAFLDENGNNNYGAADYCITVKELIEIEKRRQAGQLKVLTVNIDNYQLSTTDGKIIERVFKNEGILRGDSVDFYRGLNVNPYLVGQTDTTHFVGERFKILLKGTAHIGCRVSLNELYEPLSFYYFGRERQFEDMISILCNNSYGIRCLHGSLGEGKTAFAFHLVKRLAALNYCDTEDIFYWNFGAQQCSMSPNINLFLETVLTTFGYDIKEIIDENARAKMFLEYISKHKTVIIFDEFEKLLSIDKGNTIKNQTVKYIIHSLARECGNYSGLFLLLSALPVADFNYYPGTSKNIMIEGLSDNDYCAIFEKIGVSDRITDIKAFLNMVGRNPLLITLISKTLLNASDGSIKKVMPLYMGLSMGGDTANSESQIEAFYSFYTQQWEQQDGERLWSLKVLSILRKSCDKFYFKKLYCNMTDEMQLPKFDDITLNNAIRKLDEDNIIIKQGDNYILSSPARLYYGKLFKNENPGLYKAVNLFMARLSLANFNDESVSSVYGLEPIYDAIFYYMNAAEYSTALELFWTRVYRGRQFFSQKRLGAWTSDLNVVVSFFDIEKDWEITADLSDTDKAWLYATAAYLLNIMGDLETSRQIRKKEIEHYKNLGNTVMAAGDTQHLARNLMLLGDLDEAERQYLEALKLVDTPISCEIESRYIADIDVDDLRKNIKERYLYMLFIRGDASTSQLKDVLEQINITNLNKIGTGGFYYFLVKIELTNSKKELTKLRKQIIDCIERVKNNGKNHDIAYAYMLYTMLQYKQRKSDLNKKAVDDLCGLIDKTLEYSREAYRMDQHPLILIHINDVICQICSFVPCSEIARLNDMFDKNEVELKNILEVHYIPLYKFLYLKNGIRMAILNRDIKKCDALVEQIKENRIFSDYFRAQADDYYKEVQKLGNRKKN